MKNCELCKTKATTFCESDQASLCWDCDTKVHGANFLVARHSRTLLCHSCQRPTPWKASGTKLGNTFSFCETCKVSLREESESDHEEDVGTDDDVNDDGYSAESDVHRSDVMTDNEDGDDYDDEVNGDNQVVPFSTSSPPPPPSSSSSSDESGYRHSNMDGDFSESVSVFPLKRMRDNAYDLHLQKDDPRCSSRCSSKVMNDVVVASRTDGEAACHESWRRLKVPRTGSGRTIGNLYTEETGENFKGVENKDNVDEEADAVYV